MKKYKNIIIGAGPTGLGAAYRLKELGHSSFLVLEAESQVGGLATSYVDQEGFTWDIGGHVQFSHYDYFDDLMIKALGNDGWLHHQRESWVWMRDRFIPYPFQNNIRYLPKDELWKCLQGIIALAKQDIKVSNNFREWICNTFGEGIAEVFLLPYNYKVWAFDPSKLAYNWIGERVSPIDLEQITKHLIYEKDSISWGPNNTFQFPKSGGTGSIWEGVANLIGKQNIYLQCRVTGINPKLKIVYVGDKQYHYENLLSTMPIDMLSKIIDGVDHNIIEASNNLLYSSSHIVGVGLNGKPRKELNTKCWMYFPEDNCPFYRVTVFSNYSPNNVPNNDNQWSLMAEVSESVDKKVDNTNIINDTIQGMLNTKLIESEHDICSTWLKSIRHGYPIPSLERDLIIDEVIPYFEKIQIYSRGRFGGWKYEVSNQDHSCMQGVEWVNWVELNVPETTFKFPNTANANWGRNKDKKS